MFYFGTQSNEHLGQVIRPLKRLANEAMGLQIMDFAVTYSTRDPAEHEILMAEGLSKTSDSKHLYAPSHAIHLDPFPIRYEGEKAIARYYMLAGIVLATAERMKIPIRWGGDWDSDGEILDQDFDDLAHYEYVGDKYVQSTRKTLRRQRGEG